MSSASSSSLPGYSRLLMAMRAGKTRSLFSGGFLAICDQAAISLAAFLATVIVGRICSPMELGIYTLAAGAFWVINGIPNSLVWIPYTSHAPHLPPSRLARYAGSALIHLGFMLALVAAGLALCAVTIPAISFWLGFELTNQDRLLTVFLAMIPFTLLMMVREHLRRTLTAHLRMKELLTIDLPIAISQIGLLFGLAKWGMLSAETALLAIALACSLSVVFLVVRHGEMSFRWPSIRLHFAYNFHFGRWLLLGSIAWMMSEYSYRWLMASMHGLTELGQMGAALYIVLLVNPLLVSICYYIRAVMANQLAKEGPTGLQSLMWRASLGMAVVFGLAFSMLAIFGDQFVTFMYGNAYSGQQWVVAALCLAMFFRAVVVPVDAALMAVRCGRELAMAAVVQLVLALLLGAPLIYWYGAVGAGCAMAVSDCGSLLVRWFLFQQYDFSTFLSGNRA